MGGDTSDDGPADVELVAETLQALANPNRIRLLRGLAAGQSRTELVDQLPISESGVTNHLRRLADAGLAYRTADGWQVSPLGRFLADFLNDHMDEVAEAQRCIAAATATAVEEYEDVPLPDRERERTVEWRTWELAREELNSLFDLENEGTTGSDEAGG